LENLEQGQVPEAASRLPVLRQRHTGVHLIHFNNQLVEDLQANEEMLYGGMRQELHGLLHNVSELIVFVPSELRDAA